MNARRERRADERTRLSRTLAEAEGATPTYVGRLGGTELWMVGKILAGIPVLRDDYPADVKDAVDRRRRATLSGRCDCGARRQLVGHGLVFAHEPGCVAGDEQLDAVAARHGMAFARWSP